MKHVDTTKTLAGFFELRRIHWVRPMLSVVWEIWKACLVATTKHAGISRMRAAFIKTHSTLGKIRESLYRPPPDLAKVARVS